MLGESALSFHHMGPRDLTRVVRFGQERLSTDPSPLPHILRDKASHWLVTSLVV